MGASNATKTSGLNWLVKINTSGNNASPTWTTIVSQSNAKFQIKNKAIDVTGKDDAGWDAFIPGQSSWTLSLDGFIVLTDPGYQQIETAMKNQQAVYLEITRSDGNNYVGNAVITDWNMDLPVDKAAAFQITFQGDQALVTFPI